MIKIIQTIVLTAIVFSPLSLTSFATAHHTFSHVSTTAVAVNKARKKRIKKRRTAVTSPRKSTPDATTSPSDAMPSGGSMPIKPSKPDVSIPDKVNPSGVMTPKPGSTGMPPAGSSMPNIPGTPSTPSTPTIPSGGTPTLPTTLPTTK